MATIYSDDGITTTSNPVTTDAYGRFNFFVADGRYDLIAASGLANYTQSDVEISDVTQSAAGDAVWHVESSGLKMDGATSGSVTFAVPAIASGTNSFQAVTDTVVYKATADTLTNKTLTAPIISTITNAGTLTVPASTDTLVGRATTDTLTNKTLTGTTSGNGVSLLKFLGPAGALTGNSADQTYFTYTLPANTLQTNKGIRITAISKHTTGTTATAFRLSFGGTLTTVMNGGNASNAVQKQVYELFNNGATNAQTIISTEFNSAGNNVSLAYDTTAIDTTAGVIINVTFNVANTDQWTPEMFFVELIQ